VVKAIFLSSIDAHRRWLGERRGLDTLVVRAVNAEFSMSGTFFLFIIIINYYN
jgi:hypothetical protein